MANPRQRLQELREEEKLLQGSFSQGDAERQQEIREQIEELEEDRPTVSPSEPEGGFNERGQDGYEDDTEDSSNQDNNSGRGIVSPSAPDGSVGKGPADENQDTDTGGRGDSTSSQSDFNPNDFTDREATGNDIVTVKTDKFGNVQERTIQKARNVDNQRDKTKRRNDAPGLTTIDRDRSEQVQDAQRQIQIRQQKITESQRTKSNAQRQLRFTQNRIERLENKDLNDDTEIQVGGETVTVEERRETLQSRKTELQDIIDSNQSFVEDAEKFVSKGLDRIESFQTPEEEAEEAADSKYNIATLENTSLDDLPDTGPMENRMVAPGTGFPDRDTGIDLPDTGFREFPGGTNVQGTSFIQERLPEEDINFQPVNPDKVGAQAGRTTENLLEDIGVPQEESRFVGTQIGSLASIGVGSIQGIAQIPEATASFISDPGESTEQAVETFEEDIRGQSAGDLTQGEITEAIASPQGINQNLIGREAGDLEALSVAGGALSGGAALRRADSFVLRSPLRQVDNPTPDFERATTLDQRLQLQFPVERREVPDAPEIEGLTSEVKISTDTGTDRLEEFFQETSDEDLPFLGETGEDPGATGQELTFSEIEETQNRFGTFQRQGQTRTEIPQRRGAGPIDEPEEGFTQTELEVLSDQDEVGFEDVDPQGETETGGFERAQIGDRQIVSDASQIDNQGLTEQVDELVEQFIDADQLGAGPGSLVPDQKQILRPDFEDVDFDSADLTRPKTDIDSDSVDTVFGDRPQNTPDSDTDTTTRVDFEPGSGTGLATSAALSLGQEQGQGQESLTGQRQGQGQSQTQRQPFQFDQELETQLGLQSFNAGEFNEGEQLTGGRPRDQETRFRRDRDTDRRRRRDIDINLDFGGEGEADTQQGTSGGRSFNFAPSLDAILSGTTVTEEQAEEQGLLDQTFSGLETRPLIIEENGNNQESLF